MPEFTLTFQNQGRRIVTAFVLMSVIVYGKTSANALDAVPINLPAQSLDKDIRDLARQTGITISFSRRAFKNMKEMHLKVILRPLQAWKYY